MTVGKAMLGGFIVAGIYIGTIAAFAMSGYLLSQLFHTHPVAALAITAMWIFYIVFTGYIFSAHKLLDMRWTVTQVRKLLGE
jgi:hypothetical protein